MGDAFSNWVNRQVDNVRDVSRRIQAGETPYRPTVKEQRQVQQVHEQQAQVDRVELSSKGHMPKARVDKNHVTFEGKGSTGGDKHQAPKQNGGERQHQGSAQAEKQQPKAAKQNAAADASHAEKQPAKPQQARVEKQGNGYEKATPPAERTVRSSNEAHTARPAKVSEPVPPRTRSVLEPVIAKVEMSAQDFLKRVADAGGFDHVQQPGARPAQAGARGAKPVEAPAQGGRPGDYHAPKAPEGKSPYVELKNVPEHVRKQAGGKPEAGTVKTETPKQEAPRKQEAPKAEAPKQQAAKTETAKPEVRQQKPHVENKPAAPAEGSTLRTWAGKTVGTGLGFLGIAGGIAETKQGIEQIKNGQKLEGTLNVTAGASDVTSGTASVLYTWGKTALGSTAAKAGGVGQIMGGMSEGIQGIREKDQEKQVEGGIRVGLGVGMLTRFSPQATAASAGWVAGRFIGSHVKIGEQTVDQRTESTIGSVINAKVDADYQQSRKVDQKNYETSKDMVGRDASQMEAAGYTRKDVTDAIMGIRDQMQTARDQGKSVEELQNEAAELRKVREQLSH